MQRDSQDEQEGVGALVFGVEVPDARNNVQMDTSSATSTTELDRMGKRTVVSRFTPVW